jgi:hypothetical protein
MNGVIYCEYCSRLWICMRAMVMNAEHVTAVHLCARFCKQHENEHRACFATHIWVLNTCRALYSLLVHVQRCSSRITRRVCNRRKLPVTPLLSSPPLCRMNQLPLQLYMPRLNCSRTMHSHVMTSPDDCSKQLSMLAEDSYCAGIKACHTFLYSQ